MTREIKFRAWDKKENKMFEPSSVSWKNGVLWVCDTRGDNKLEYELINPNGELMQFTGLKDKNGKEIYEGDIVKDHQGGISEMKFGNHEFGNYIGFYLDDGKIMKAGMAWHWEVIGNIYENKELLK